MKNKYYTKKQDIQELSKKGKGVGKVEKWHAHKKGIPHKAISVAIIFKNKYILQHRKHPIFDGVFDLTSSSHPIFKDGMLQDLNSTVLDTLKREWNIDKKDLIGDIKNQGEIYYKAKDIHSSHFEHEYCVMFLVKVRSMPAINLNYAYGLSLVDKKDLIDEKSPIHRNLAPWSKVAVKKGLI